MKRLMNQVKEDAKKNGITGKKVSKWINVSEGMVTKYYKGESDMPAMKFIDLVDFIYEDPACIKEYIISFIQKTERNDNLQELLEWSANRGDKEYMDEVHRRVVNSPLLKDSMIYQMITGRNMNQLSAEEFYLKVEDFKLSENLLYDSKILLKIATLYSHLDLKSYSVMIPLANNILQSLDAINSDYVRDSFKVRTNEMLAHAFLKRGDIENVEKIAQKVLTDETINRYPLPANSILMILSEANIFKDPNSSIRLINSAIKMFKDIKVSSHKMRKSVLESTHDFIKIHCGDFNGLYLSDISERAHSLAKQGYSKEALIILDELEEINGELSAHQLYYKGLATDNKKYFQQSLNKFVRQGDSFYTQLIDLT
ncbi:AimR family lysis-lysogeny pheromone receptor [Rossellomorea sp. NPDC071047]|uniref:AimR family lysis-lysogeny pheromone receptor n=1 Tax=Rossellomorea sp. NPDC071047 TaxID=3390675 RepID=UPI003CFEA4DC